MTKFWIQLVIVLLCEAGIGTSYHVRGSGSVRHVNNKLSRWTRDTARLQAGPDTINQVLLGEEVEFNCGVDAVSDVTEVRIWWVKDGVNISNSEDKYFIEVSKSSEGSVTSTLSD